MEGLLYRALQKAWGQMVGRKMRHICWRRGCGWKWGPQQRWRGGVRIQGWDGSRIVRQGVGGGGFGTDTVRGGAESASKEGNKLYVG